MDGTSNGSHHHHCNGFCFSSSSSLDRTMATGMMTSGAVGGDEFFRGYDDGRNSESVKLFAASLDSAAGWLPPKLSSSGNYIEHSVSRFDTLAGVAIRYGVEVADIKRLNGLVTDNQMFAHKTLQIPRPGRHPPSTCMSNGSNGPRYFSALLTVSRWSHAWRTVNIGCGVSGTCGSGKHTPPRHAHGDLLDSLQSLKLKSSQCEVSSAMSSLQGYYGLKSDNRLRSSGGCEMAVFNKGGCYYLENGHSGIPLSLQRKSQSVANGLFNENGESFHRTSEGMDADSDRWSEKLIRRRQKSEMDFTSTTPEFWLKEDSFSSAEGFSAPPGKNLALRSKASRASLANDAEMGPTNSGGIDTILSENLAAMRKSSSTSSLQDQESSSSSLLSIWNLKPDLQALSTAAIARPIFDGLPKPGKKNKAALD